MSGYSDRHNMDIRHLSMDNCARNSISNSMNLLLLAITPLQNNYLKTYVRFACLYLLNKRDNIYLLINQHMEKLALLARLEAKPGKEQEVADFLKSALPLAQGEEGTIRWYALQLSPSTFGIFDTFEAEEGRDAHLTGPIAQALMANASALLAKDPVIEKVALLAVK